MSDAFDPYGSGRERVRESVKWLYGVATGVAAVLLATISWTVLPDLLQPEPGSDATNARLAAGVLLVCVLFGVGATLRALSSRPFGLTDLTGSPSLTETVNGHPEIFSDKIGNVSQLETGRLQDAATFQRVLSFASYLDMRQRAIVAQWVVAVAALVGAGAVGVLLQEIGAAEKPKQPQKMEITLSPESVEALAEALRR